MGPFCNQQRVGLNENMLKLIDQNNVDSSSFGAKAEQSFMNQNRQEKYLLFIPELEIESL